MRLMRLFLISGIVAGLNSVAQADLIYDFSGVLPIGSSSHSMVQDGESFLASFVVNPATMDSNPDPSVGNYQSAGNILSGSISFSGGYTFDFPNASANLGTLVFNDFVLGAGQIIDSVRVQNIGPDIPANGFILVHAQNLTGGPTVPPLLDDSLPIAGTSLVSGGLSGSFLQLAFIDSIGEVYYAASSANNVSFNARSTAVPEPGSFALLGLGSIGVATARRRRRQGIFDLRFGN